MSITYCSKKISSVHDLNHLHRRLGDKSVKVQMFKVKKTACGGIPGNRSKSSEVNEVVGDNQGANLAQGVIEELRIRAHLLIYFL